MQVVIWVVKDKELRQVGEGQCFYQETWEVTPEVGTFEHLCEAREGTVRDSGERGFLAGAASPKARQ